MGIIYRLDHEMLFMHVPTNQTFVEVETAIQFDVP